MTLSVLRLSNEEHDEFVRQHPNGHLMQMTAWGREKEHTGWTWRTVAVGTDGQIRGVALILFRRTPMLPMALAYVPRGFVLDWADTEAVDALVAEASRVAKAGRGVLLRLDPAVPVADPHTRAALESRGFVKTDPGDDPAKTLAQPALRMVTDISDLDALHTRLSQGTRWSIRKAAKSGLVYESVGRDKIPAFYELMRTTGERDGFGIRSMEYFTTLWDVLSPTDEIIVSLVRLDPTQAIESAERLRAESSTQLEKARAKQAETHHAHADHAARTERDPCTNLLAVRAIGRRGNAQIGPHRQPHSEVTDRSGEQRPEQERDAASDPDAAVSRKDEQEPEHDHGEQGEGAELSAQIRAGPLLNRCCDLSHLRRAFLGRQHLRTQHGCYGKAGNRQNGND